MPPILPARLRFARGRQNRLPHRPLRGAQERVPALAGRSAQKEGTRRRTGRPAPLKGDSECRPTPSRSAPAVTDNAAYLTTYDLARQRATVSDFDVHVVRNADGSYWYVDEGDYALELSEFEDRIVHTLEGRRSGLY